MDTNDVSHEFLSACIFCLTDYPSICAAFLVLLPFVMKETRASVLLTRIARKLRKETGDHRYRARVEDERAKLSTLIWISCTRPIRESPYRNLVRSLIVRHPDLMFTEMVVFSFSVSPCSQAFFVPLMMRC